MSQGLTERISELIGPSLEAMGFDLVRVRYTGGGRPILQIMAERSEDGQMGIDDCESVSRAVSAILDVEDPISDAYNLEVSSPGVDRPLTRPKDFERYAGFDAKLELSHPVDGRKRFKGVLKGFSDGSVAMDVAGVSEAEAAMRFPLGEIAEAKLVLTDRLIEASLRESKAREKARSEQTEDTE
ncbi:MAG: ribosome maturation factor RimP [Minwuia sp.]|uniref:ribosome maturation factor RimP n=1 Tax=Minwuia sp. TaxID=2493630 RepID=UPI003A83F81A